MLLRRIAASLVMLAACAVHAQTPLAQFAGPQLDMAQAALERARGALATHDYAAARRFAAQAELDARLAWAMTESGLVRGAAARLALEAERVRWRGLTAAGVRRETP